MKEFKEFITEINRDAGKPIESIVTFFVNNGWFGEKLTQKDGKIFLSSSQITLFTEKLTPFLTSTPQDLYEMFREKFPMTNEFFQQFIEEKEIDDEARYYLTDFMLLHMTKDIFLYKSREMDKLVGYAINELIKAHGDEFTFFLAWLRLKVKTAYKKDYVLNKRYTLDEQNGAYSFDEYIELFYNLFCEEYIEDNDMFAKAAESKNYTDTWLYLAMYLIRPLRYTDMQRIYHPILPCTPEEVLEQIKNNTFSDYDARSVILSITKRMSWLPLTPNKTAGTSNVPPIVFEIPTSCEIMMGKLFALAEAHRIIKGEPDAPIIRKVSTYQEISRYMGEEIGELFLHSDFRSRSATKSFLQEICMIADEADAIEGVGIHVKGYYIAALARSHKGSYGKFATTTFEYLKDAKFNNLTPETVAFELLERGVFSFMSSMLLKMILDSDFNRLSPTKQTQVIKALDMSPREIETVVATVKKSQKFARETIVDLVKNEADALTVLHRIANGEAFSKQGECMCLMSALHKICPYNDRSNCVGCKFEISTRATFYLMIEEYTRIRDLYASVNNPLEKEKYKQLAISIIAPKMDEMLESIKECYGEETFEDYEKILKENT